MSTELELVGVSRRFGSLQAVDSLDLRLEAGRRHAVIGPNGAGKSTLFALIAGALRVDAGHILVRDTDVTREPEHRRAARGVVRTFQHSSLFLTASALDNVLVAVSRRAEVSWSMLTPVRRRRRLVGRARTMLDRVGLGDRQSVVAGALSHGERRQLEVAIALACEPALLLLDEPAAGMSAAETARLSTLLAALPESITVLLVEHDLDLVFDLADTVTVLHLGRHLVTGSPHQVRASEEVQAAYLGAADTSELFPGAGP